MAIIQAAIGDHIREFDEGTSLDEVWAFVNLHMTNANTPKGIVLMDDSGDTIGCIWDSSLYYAHWETPFRMRAYFELASFDRSE